MPAAVGVDIGCGMLAVRTQYSNDDIAAVGAPLTDLHAAIAKAVPLSAGAANQEMRATAAKRIAERETMPGAAQAEQALPRWRFQLGTLGSGNHFIEVSLDEHDQVWLFLHSGSRGVGNRLAGRHIKVAQQPVMVDGEVRVTQRAGFDVAELLASRGTVYMLGAEDSQVAPLVCALTAILPALRVSSRRRCRAAGWTRT